MMEGPLARILDAVRTAGSLILQIVGSLRYNWGIGLLSLGLAISLWVFVTDRENPEVSGGVQGTVAIEVVNVPANQAVFSLSQDSVAVRARASESVLDRLTSEDFRAIVDLSAVDAGGSVDVQVESTEPRASVLSVSPAQIQVELEVVTSADVPVEVRLVGTPPPGFSVGDMEVQPELVVVSGPRSLIDLVAVVEADVNLTGYTTPFDGTLLLQARDGQGGNIEGVTVGPETARVTVEITQQIFSAVFVVLPDVSGVPATGFIVTGIEVEPAFIVVSGGPEALANLALAGGIGTEAVIIEAANADVVRPVALRLPEGAVVLQTNVTVTIRIEPISPVPGTPP